MYNDQLVYKVVICAFFGISLWTEKVALNMDIETSITWAWITFRNDMLFQYDK